MLIAIEGIDGSGKGTQADLLFRRLRADGRRVRLFSFPSYTETFFGREVGRYLNGDYGALADVPVAFAAMLYAGDRFEKKQAIMSALEDNGIVICDRYVPSNLAHQAAKLPEPEQNEFRRWIATLEYEIYGLPRPDCVFFLDMPPEESTRLVLKKKKRSYTDAKLDLHEAETGYLARVHRLFATMAQEEDWDIIPCCAEGEMLAVDTIANRLYDIVKCRLSAAL